jgi:hypothetical protein
MKRNILQIATADRDIEPVLKGVRALPINKLILICYPEDKKYISDKVYDVQRILNIPVEIYEVKDDVFMNFLVLISKIIRENRREYSEIVVNVTGGDKSLTCAAITSAFINGLKAIHIMGDKTIMLPILKLKFDRMVTEAKRHILKAILKGGGEVESLTELETLTGYDKPLLSYHINGSEETYGLIDLGLVEAKRGKRGRMHIKLTMLGRILIDTLEK